MATTQISDVIVPEIYNAYLRRMSMEDNAIIRSGAVVADSELSSMLAGGGLKFHSRSFNPLDADDDDRVSSDSPTQLAQHSKITSAHEVQLRLSRNKSWSSMDLAAALAGTDPAQAIQSYTSDYWLARQQAALIASIRGVFADNAKAPTAGEHVLNDMTNNISGGTGAAAAFSASAFIDAQATMGSHQSDLSLVVVHPVIYTEMRKQNLIDFIPVSINGAAISVPTYQGAQVLMDSRIPSNAGVFETWLFGRGAIRFGFHLPMNAVATERKEDIGNGAGGEILYNRQEWVFHPVGYAYRGGDFPTNANTTGNLSHEDSWQRVFKDRREIRIARLISKQF